MKLANVFTALLTTVTLIIISSSLAANIQDNFQPSFQPTLEVSQLQGSIMIDGVLNDSGWRNAARADNFAEVSPGDQVKPPVESAALVTYNETHLYVALIAHDDPSEVRVSLRDRDRIFQDDYFGVMLDTYGDFTWGYELFVNPLGIQGNLRMLSNGGEDISFDIVFESQGMVTDSGYQVEIAIPFSSLRFPGKDEQTWNINFWRDQQRDVRRRYAWSAQDRDNPCFMCQWGTMNGIRGIKPSSNIDILPNIVAYQAGELTDGPGSDFDNSNPDAELSLNARYGLSSNASLELAINPDFSQIESDAAQIDVNNPFGLFYPERRPFFQEGSDLFQTYINAVYTRSINDPIFASKYTGQFGRTRIAYIIAQDDLTPLTIPFQERTIITSMDKSWSNILRIRQALFEDSFVGLLITDRRINDFEIDGENQLGGSGSNYGVDMTMRFLDNFYYDLQLLGSYTREPDAPELIDTTEEDGYGQVYFNRDRNTVALDGESFGGHAVFTGVRYNARHFYTGTSYFEQSPDFRADNGRIDRNDRRQLYNSTNLSWQPNRDWLVEWGPNFNLGRVWNHDGRFMDEWIRPGIYFQTKGMTNINIGSLISRERYRDVMLNDIWEVSLNISSTPFEGVRGGFYIATGDRIYRGTPEMADNLDFNAWLNLQPTQQLRLEPSINFARMNSKTTGENIFEGYIFRNRLDYQFTREWFVRLIVQYNDFSKRLDIEPLLTYKVNPFTVFYLGFSNRFRQYDPANYENLDNYDWDVSSRQFFAKLQYLFRI